MEKISRFIASFLLLVFSLQTVDASENFGAEEFERTVGQAVSSLSDLNKELPTPEPQKAEQQPPEGNSMPLGSKWGYLVLAYHAVCAHLTENGLLPHEGDIPGFDEISQRSLEAVSNSRYPARRAGQSSLLEDPGFIAEMEAITGSKFSAGTAEPLIDGPEAFVVKDRLMREAKKSIYAVTYAVYDDVTGRETTEILLAKKKEGVDVKLVVDEKMAHIFGGKLLKTMEKEGIEVMRYSNPSKAHNYLHVKMLIVDGASSVIGGMNYGDPYSRKGNGLKWRDTDILYTGAAVDDSLKRFADIWNTGRKDPAGKFTPVTGGSAKGGPALVSVLHQDPPKTDPPILLSVIKAMYGATKKINIENAYIVAIPAFTQAVADAAARGVEVNILTNSKESIDSDGKSMAEAILGSAKIFAASGANVYLKQGQTLHSKFMTVDGVFSNVGSYNMHPRSERYDMELNINVLDKTATAKLDAAFAKDIKDAKKIDAEDVSPGKPGWLSRIMEKYFYSQLSHNQKN